ENSSNRAILLKALLDIGAVNLVEHLVSSWSIKCPIGMLVKIHLLREEYNIAYDLLKENYVNIPYNDPWFDVNDLIILANELQNKELSEKLVYNSNDQFEWVNYLFNISSDAKISSSIKDKIMMLLQKSIQY